MRIIVFRDCGKIDHFHLFDSASGLFLDKNNRWDNYNTETQVFPNLELAQCKKNGLMMIYSSFLGDEL